jgi:hypothetical protein
MTELNHIVQETVKFMRGEYLLDEIGNGKNEVKFRHGKKTILTVYIQEDRLDFLIVFGQKEREEYAKISDTFSDNVRNIYDSTKTFHDGKWMMFHITDLKILDEMKKLIYIKKKPNRKPLPKENAIYSKCGHRCDLCIHYSYSGISDEFRKELEERLSRIYSGADWSLRCPSCNKQEGLCNAKKCAKVKEVDICTKCSEYPCKTVPVGYKQLESKTIYKDDVTWGILPYVENQYGN